MKNERVEETNEAVDRQRNCEWWLFDKCALRKPFWDEERQKSGICKSNGSSDYYRAEVRLQVKALSTCGIGKPGWNLALGGWFQAALVYFLEASRSQGMEGDQEPPLPETENKWIFQRVKNGRLGTCPHVVRKWPTAQGGLPSGEMKGRGVTDHHPPVLGCSCHSRHKLASNSNLCC